MVELRVMSFSLRYFTVLSKIMQTNYQLYIISRIK